MPVRTCACLALALTVLACEPSPSPSPNPSPTASAPASGLAVAPSSNPIASATPVAPTASVESATPVAPTASVEPTPAATPEPTIPTDSLVRVVTDDLRMRTAPGIGADSERLEPLLDRGTVAWVLAGPRSASGFDWYRIRPLGGPQRVMPPEIGWVAAADHGGAPWIRPLRVDCPRDRLEMTDLLELGEAGLLQCVGGQPVTLRARLGAYETGPCFELEPDPGPVRFEGTWLTECARLFLVDPHGTPHYSSPAIPVVTSPDIDLDALIERLPYPAYKPRNWPTVRVTGQVDHPAAHDCGVARGGTPDGRRAARAVAVLGCRMTFVVTAIEGLPR